MLVSHRIKASDFVGRGKCSFFFSMQMERIPRD